jgi:hypothetical protein
MTNPLLLAGVAGAVALVIIFWPRTRPPVRYPELAKVDRTVEALLRKEWPPPGPVDALGYDPDFVRAVERARSIGATAALPALKLLVEEYGRRDRAILTTAPYWNDRNAEPLFAWLAEVSQEPQNAVLIRILEDSEAHPELRRGAAIALSWPGNQGALEALVGRALDRQEDHDLRRAVLYRLPRLALPAPPALRELLDLPFGGLDAVAAAALALLGDCEAPSLILDGLRNPLAIRELSENFLIEAAARITGKEYDPRSSLPPLLRDEVQPWAEALEGWLQAHPASFETAFERERRGYLTSAQRKRELALNSLEDILSARDEDPCARLPPAPGAGPPPPRAEGRGPNCPRARGGIRAPLPRPPDPPPRRPVRP